MGGDAKDSPRVDCLERYRRRTELRTCPSHHEIRLPRTGGLMPAVHLSLIIQRTQERLLDTSCNPYDPSCYDAIDDFS